MPVLKDGTLVSLDSTVKLREGSWPVIGCLHQDISHLPVIEWVDNSLVKLFQPGKRPVGNNHSIDCELVILPKFNPDSKPHFQRITSVEALCKLIESESMFRKPVEHETLDHICKWVESKRCYTITYPDIYLGVSLVGEVFSLAKEPAQC